MAKKTPHEIDSNPPEQAEEKKEGFFTLGWTGWFCLLIIDAILLLAAVFLNNLVLGAIALVLVVVIEKRGSGVLLAKYNKRMEETKARGLTLDKDQQKAVVADLWERIGARRAEKRAEREARREARRKNRE